MKTYAEKNWGSRSDVIAYSLNFVQISYLKHEAEHYFEMDCQKCGHLGRQKADLTSSKSEMSKKDYYQLSTGGMGVSPKMHADMLEYGISPNCFRPIRNAKNKILGYQIKPEKVWAALPAENGWSVSSECPNCHFIKYEAKEELESALAYNGLGYPIYLGDATFKDDIVLLEGFDDILISTKFYHYLMNLYPRIECRPVFPGTIELDPEYIRLTKAHYNWERLDAELDKVIENGDDEERSKAIVSKALLQMCFPNQETFAVEPIIRQYYSQYPSLEAALVGSYLLSITNSPDEDIYYPFLESKSGECSPIENARLLFVKTLHLYRNGEIGLKQVKEFYEKARLTGESCNAFSRFIEYLEKEKVCFPESSEIWEYEDSEKPLGQLIVPECFMQHFMD